MKPKDRQLVEQFRSRKILITGGAGFVGSNLLSRLLAFSPRQIMVVDNLLSSERVRVPDRPEIAFIEGSIADDAILNSFQDDLDYVFHLSTYHGNQSSIHDPLADHENNLLTTLKLFDRLKYFRRLQKVVYSGAGCAVAEKTYGQAHATPEDAPISLQMDSPYSISKIVGEFYAVYYYDQHKLPTVRARFQNVYGPGEILGAGRWRGTPATVWRNVIPTFIYKALKGQALPVEGDGGATRDFIYVGDIVEGLLACAMKGVPGEVYNLASGVETSIINLASTINELAGNTAPIEWRPRRSWDRSGKRFGSTQKARREIGFEAWVGLREGLLETIEWTGKNMALIEACMRKHEAHMNIF